MVEVCVCVLGDCLGVVVFWVVWGCCVVCVLWLVVVDGQGGWLCCFLLWCRGRAVCGAGVGVGVGLVVSLVMV